MTRMIQCISPVDGRVYAERPALSQGAAEAAVGRAKAAQPGWAALPLAERIAKVQAGVAALNAMDASDEPPALLVTDVVMPRLGGVELAHEMRRRVPGIPVLFMSGYTSSAVLPDTDLRNAAFIAKPFSTDDLMRRIAELLETPTSPASTPR